MSTHPVLRRCLRPPAPWGTLECPRVPQAPAEAPRQHGTPHAAAYAAQSAANAPVHGVPHTRTREGCTRIPAGVVAQDGQLSEYFAIPYQDGRGSASHAAVPHAVRTRLPLVSAMLEREGPGTGGPGAFNPVYVGGLRGRGEEWEQGAGEGEGQEGVWCVSHLPVGLAAFGASVTVTVGARVGGLVSPTLVGAGVPLAKHSGCAEMNTAPIGCALKYTSVVVAEHQRGTVARLTAEPHARFSAAPAARHAASEPM